MNRLDDPLTGFAGFHTTDLEQARRHFSRILSPHALQLVHRHAQLDFCCRVVRLGEAIVVYAHYGAAVRLDPGALEDFYLVGIPIAGASTIRSAGWELVSHAGVASVQSCLRPIRTQWDDGCRKLSIKIPRAAVERRLAAMLGVAPAHPVEFQPRLELDTQGGATWNSLIRFLLAELTPDSCYLATPIGRRTLDETLISTLLLVQPHNYSAALAAPANTTVPSYVRRAEEMIAADPVLEDGLDSIANRLGISVRTLYAGFRRYRKTTPMHFVHAQRLEKARHILCHSPPATRVTDVALAVGYAHFGRFAAQYRKRFGELPSVTLRSS